MKLDSHIGIVGLATMGQNLCLNLLDQGYRVAAWNLETQEAIRFAESQDNDSLHICEDLDELIQHLPVPRKIILLVRAGEPVDEVIAQCLGLLYQGDILIDAGNSHYGDSERRARELGEKGVEFVGLGVSGGSEGARRGPSLMFGGSDSAWQATKEILERTAAQSDYGPCLANFGKGGAGHFVKMIHNGIEYAEMQLLAEAYDLMNRGMGMSSAEQISAFERFNEGPLNSFLVELTARVLRSRQTRLDEIVDSAGQKGTGRWALEAGLDLGVPIPTIAASVDARAVSALLDRRLRLSQRISFDRDVSNAPSLEDIERALIFGKICAFVQGVDLIESAKEAHQWSLNIADIPKTWREGCILRGVLLDHWISEIEGTEPKSLIDVSYFWEELVRCDEAARIVLSDCMEARIPMPALTASLSWFDSITSGRLPQNLTQAQRDAFGAHGLYLWNDPDRLVHKEW
jgi:6-phosphogluconate dehydrogenase